MVTVGDDSSVDPVDQSSPPVPGLPLDGLLVVDLSEGVAGPYCTKLLGGFGARIVKVERPGGDPARRRGPYRGGHPDSDGSGLFLHLNTDKEGIVVDLDRAKGTGVVRDLIRRADVVVESFRPGLLEEKGLDPSVLLEMRPSIVVCSVTAFGQTGPYRDFEMTSITTFAMGGPMSSSGFAAREPVKQAVNVVEVQAGNTAFTVTLAALLHSMQTGRGQHVDISNLQTQAGSTDRIRGYHLAHQYTGTVVLRDPLIGGTVGAVGGRFVAADGVTVTPGVRVWPAHIERMVAVLSDSRVQAILDAGGPRAVAEEGDLVNSVIADWVAARTGRRAMREAQAKGWPMVVVNDALSLLSDEHLVARGFWHYADHPVAGTLPYAGAPWRIDGGGWRQRRTAPMLGQHTDAVLSDIAGYSEADIAQLRLDGVVG